MLRENALLSAFLFVELGQRSQLSNWKWKQRAKSKKSFLRSCFLHFLRLKLISIVPSSPYFVSLSAGVPIGPINWLSRTIYSRCCHFAAYILIGVVTTCLCLISLSVLIGLQILLIRAGIELNPGPAASPSTVCPSFCVVSQNCRGLAVCKKSCKLVKSIQSSKSNLSTILFGSVQASIEITLMLLAFKWPTLRDVKMSFGWVSQVPFSLKCSRFSYFNKIPLKVTILISLAVLIGLATLLIRAGVELNPGPRADYPDFRVISQNCRGLTDCRKTCCLVKKLSASRAGHSPVFACLQETHCINRFALNNLHKGTHVIDDGERNQKGVSILIPEEFQICDSLTSGVGRWAIGVVQAKNSTSASRVVIATVYAPNCHRESKLMFQDFLFNLDLITERLSEQSHDFVMVVTGDFNVVLDPDNGQLNRLGSPGERSLATYILC